MNAPVGKEKKSSKLSLNNLLDFFYKNSTNYRRNSEVLGGELVC